MNFDLDTFIQKTCDPRAQNFFYDNPTKSTVVNFWLKGYLSHAFAEPGFSIPAYVLEGVSWESRNTRIKEDKILDAAKNWIFEIALPYISYVFQIAELASLSKTSSVREIFDVQKLVPRNSADEALIEYSVSILIPIVKRYSKTEFVAEWCGFFTTTIICALANRRLRALPSTAKDEITKLASDIVEETWKELSIDKLLQHMLTIT